MNGYGCSILPYDTMFWFTFIVLGLWCLWLWGRVIELKDAVDYMIKWPKQPPKEQTRRQELVASYSAPRLPARAETKTTTPRPETTRPVVHEIQVGDER